MPVVSQNDKFQDPKQYVGMKVGKNNVKLPNLAVKNSFNKRMPPTENMDWVLSIEPTVTTNASEL